MSKRKSNRGGYTAAKASSAGTKVRVIAIIVIILVAIYVILSLTMGFVRHSGAPLWNPVQWGNTAPDTEGKTEESEHTTPLLAVTGDGEAMYDVMSYAMPAAMTFVRSAAETRAASGVTVSVSLSNAYIRGEYNWSFDFENPDSEWATGKSASDYFRLVPDEDNHNEATVLALKAFGEPIIVTAELIGSNSVGTCKIDYLHRFSSNIIEGEVYAEFGDTLTLAFDSLFGDGTKYGDVLLTNSILSYTVDFEDSFYSCLKMNVELLTAEYTEDFYCTLSSDGLSVDTSIQLEYSLFIKNFDNYSTEQKQAIYYAWYTASSASEWTNGFVTDLVYSYKGVQISNYTTMCCINISGEELGSTVSPDVNLNGNIVL